MSILRENIVYTILALVAIVLIGVTIGLQLVIITGQNPTVVSGAAQQATLQAEGNNGQQIAFAVATVTETPAVLIIQPAPVGGAQNNDAQDSQAQPAIVEPTPTEPTPTEPTPTEAALVVEQPPAVPTEAEAAPPTPAPPTPTAVAPALPTPAPAAATEAVLPLDASVFRIGFTNRGYGCTTVSQIAEQILEEQLAIAADLVSFDSVEEMLLAVANNEVNMTMCYLDPDDRELLRGDNKRTIGFKMVQLGSYYWQNDERKLQMWVNLPTMGELRMPEQACLLNFLRSLQFTETDLDSIEVNNWLTTHAAELTEWVACQ